MIDRDTHFQKAAEQVWDEIEQKIDDLDICLEMSILFPLEPAIRKHLVTILTRYSYDLVEHACRHITEPMTYWPIYDMISEIPDMTERRTNELPPLDL